MENNSEPKFTIRTAVPGDAGGILAVYAPYITGTCVTFETEVPPADVFAARAADIMRNYPYFICQSDGEIIGFAYASKKGERAAYKYSADVSVYVAEKFHKQGIATKLYAALFEEMTASGIFTAFAGIALPNENSVRLHEKFGFTRAGLFRNVGYKHGRWIDLLWMAKQLKHYDNPEGNI